MFIPILEIHGKTLILQNFLSITDISTNRKSVVTAKAKNGVEIEFVNEDADELNDQLEKLLVLADNMQLPIVGVDNQVLILPSFLLFEEDEDADGKPIITLTDDAGNDLIFTGTNAALIIARIDYFANGVKQLFTQLESAANN